MNAEGVGYLRSSCSQTRRDRIQNEVVLNEYGLNTKMNGPNEKDIE